MAWVSPGFSEKPKTTVLIFLLSPICRHRATTLRPTLPALPAYMFTKNALTRPRHRPSTYDHNSWKTINCEGASHHV